MPKEEEKVTEITPIEKEKQKKMLIDEINTMIRENCKENDLVRLISQYQEAEAKVQNMKKHDPT